jgi:hypothetical protein
MCRGSVAVPYWSIWWSHGAIRFDGDAETTLPLGMFYPSQAYLKTFLKF